MMAITTSNSTKVNPRVVNARPSGHPRKRAAGTRQSSPRRAHIGRRNIGSLRDSVAVAEISIIVSTKEKTKNKPY
jgi:hypothetical protein